MGYWRDTRSKDISARIAELTAGMDRLPLRGAVLSPRPCPICHGHSRAAAEPCAGCGGSGSIRAFVRDDPSNAVVVRGPCGLGEQCLVAVRLADGRPGYVHLRQCCICEEVLYVASASMLQGRPDQMPVTAVDVARLAGPPTHELDAEELHARSAASA